jgi:xanthine dehydrogenase iron-sulfur cluster and FAD-binding subunit A
MSSDAPVPLPRTAVPLGISDPVEQARAELKAALAAIDEKANVPRRLGNAVDDTIAKARAFQRRNPTAAAATIVAGAAAVGLAVWGFVRLYTR